MQFVNSWCHLVKTKGIILLLKFYRIANGLDYKKELHYI